ncbi:MAG TPA: AMP-binding protein, partial [Minicystis sp.]|nr:AMP-binding protein [Minicystis sp.]
MAGLSFAAPAVDVERREDGAVVLRSRHALGDYPRHVGDVLRAWSERAPERAFLMERDASRAVRSVTYGEAREAVERLAAAFVQRGLDAESPVLVLSENGIDHALVAFAAMHAGVPVAPVSTAYSLASRDFAKLRAIFAIVEPGLVYASDGRRFGPALDALGVPADRVVTSDGARGTALARLLDARPGPELERRFLAQTPDTVAKILFTSGSTGEPKGVLNTQRMLCSNQRAIEVAWPFLRERPPRVVDWLPWSHTFGGNHNQYMALFHGGTLFVDDGRPTPELVGRTLENLAALAPTLYFNVPRGFAVLLPRLEADLAAAQALFGDLDVCFYAAASLPAPLWERLEALALRVRGRPVAMLSAWGSTETAPMATTVHFEIRRAGVIGLPAPGTAIKLAPVSGKLELRVAGPNVTPGYHKRPDLLAAALDEEGFFRMGDAGRLADDADPSRGLVFDGRLAEDFKLGSGTWVRVGAVRQALVAAGEPLVADAVIAGHDRDEVG